MKILRRQEKRLFKRVVMVGQMTRNFAHRHVMESGAIKYLARRLPACPTAPGRNLNIMIVCRGHLELGVEPQDQSRNDQPPPMVKYHQRKCHLPNSVSA